MTSIYKYLLYILFVSYIYVIYYIYLCYLLYIYKNILFVYMCVYICVCVFVCVFWVHLKELVAMERRDVAFLVIL